MPFLSSCMDVSCLVLQVQADAEWIAKKAGHLTIARFSPSDVLRHAESLEARAASLEAHARQLCRRALEVLP